MLPLDEVMEQDPPATIVAGNLYQVQQAYDGGNIVSLQKFVPSDDGPPSESVGIEEHRLREVGEALIAMADKLAV